jgi:phage terminase Nu1 subunit (DNA packaging protein)
METAPNGDLLAGYLTEQQAADQLGVGLRTLRTWRRQGLGPPITYLGRRPVFRLEALRDWLRQRERQMPRETKRKAV